MYIHISSGEKLEGARGEVSFALLQKLEESALILVKFLI